MAAMVPWAQYDDGMSIALAVGMVPDETGSSSTPLQTSSLREVLSAVQTLVSTLRPESPVFATFHDGRVHDPLGGGSYAFQKDVVEPVLFALMNDEILSNGEKEPLLNKKSMATPPKICSPCYAQLPTRPIVLHAGAQPNNSPHAGTIIVFCYAFSLARAIRDRMQAIVTGTELQPPPISVEITFIDTAPVPGHETSIEGIKYQKSYRDVPEALNTHMADYDQILQLLSTWSEIPFENTFQSEFLSQPVMPSLLRYIIAHHEILGHQLSPKYGKLALRAACPVLGCGLAEKHGRLNLYSEETNTKSGTESPKTTDSTITFHCPHHGRHIISTSDPGEVACLEANAPARNLIRSMSQMLDTSTHHVRITGSDYAGMYQEALLYRPLAGWSRATGLAAGRTPQILYAPLIVDWSGAKLSKSLYVREGGYQAMELFGTEGLCSFSQLKVHFGDDGAEGLRRLWEEVQGWLEDPRKLFRTFSVEYLRKVVMEGQEWA
ncbi:hypothetical protein N7481_007898 [Penicillium waksmanii]|uniref:uncharacterized protein n=1 Tax=Penicillium waksmanii TaxID=69791 RepID=UPI002547E0CF|nr:uncharacterized protein N7481_007898 [Penicillium waksmanii]KAJ5980600.1 hypothetical protein N7481_007898 [Penicillium waksmanii]